MMSTRFFKENVIKVFDETKKKLDYKIPVHKKGDLIGYLIPIKKTDDIIESLKEWREKNQHAFPTVFKVTLEGTKKWLENQVIGRQDRILFIVEDIKGVNVGHMGLSNFDYENKICEIDNVVKGVNSEKGIMTCAHNALIDWAFFNLYLRKLSLRVFSDNDKAIALYLRCGFRKIKDIPLKKIEKEDRRIIFEEIEREDYADRFFTIMELDNPNFRTEKRILTAGLFRGRNEIDYVNDAITNGWNENWNYYIKKFEEEFAKYIGVKYALCTSSCTGAMHLALASLGIKEGDEVIVPDFTWIATAAVVKYVGATPVFADVDKDSWTISPETIEKAITKKTKAIIPVHLYGHPAEMDKIMEIARRHNLYVVEDAAPSIGATINGKKTGSFGDFAAFSFQGAKLVVTGEGGILLTNNKELYETAKNLNDHGRDPEIPFWINRIGYKYKMSNLQAACGLAQLEKIDYLIKRKRQIFRWYDEKLKDVKAIKLNYEAKKRGVKSIYWMTSILLDKNIGITREKFMKRLDEEFDIDTRPVFPKISKFLMFEEINNPITEDISKQGINLPSGVCLNEESVDYICGAIKKILNQLKDEQRILEK